MLDTVNRRDFVAQDVGRASRIHIKSFDYSGVRLRTGMLNKQYLATRG